MNLRSALFLVALAPLACGGVVAPGADGGARSDAGATPVEDVTAPPRDDSPPLCFDPSCTVSFRNDLFPTLLASGGKGSCATAACHGATTEPIFKDAMTAYMAFTQARIDGRPYVLPCARDPSASTILCNLGGTSVCGVAMPLPPGSGFSTADLQKIRTWVECGAPFN